MHKRAKYYVQKVQPHKPDKADQKLICSFTIHDWEINLCSVAI